MRNLMVVPGSYSKMRKPVLFSAAAIVVVVAVAAVFLLWHWPFSREAVLKDLEEASMSKVHMDAFHGTYFPRPGCELDVRGIRMISVESQFLEITYSSTLTSVYCPASPVCFLLPANSPERSITSRFKA